MLAGELELSCTLYLVCHGLHSNFSKSELHLTQQFSFSGLLWNTVDMSVSLPSGKLIEMDSSLFLCSCLCLCMHTKFLAQIFSAGLLLGGFAYVVGFKSMTHVFVNSFSIYFIKNFNKNL